MGHLHRTTPGTWKSAPAPQPSIIGVLGYLRDNGVGGNDVLHLLGPGVHETEPSTPQCDEGAVFDFEFVTVGVDLLSHLQHWRHTRQHSE